MRGDGGPHPSGRRSSGSTRRFDGMPVLTPPTGLPVVPDDPRALADAVPRPAVPPVVAAPPVVRPCVCGHAAETHEHWRPGTDCGRCGVDVCAKYRRRGGMWRRLLRSVGLLR
jgi:hypothetical protein